MIFFANAPPNYSQTIKTSQVLENTYLTTAKYNIQKIKEISLWISTFRVLNRSIGVMVSKSAKNFQNQFVQGLKFFHRIMLSLAIYNFNFQLAQVVPQFLVIKASRNLSHKKCTNTVWESDEASEHAYWRQICIIELI